MSKSKRIKATDLSTLKTCDRLVYLSYNGDYKQRLPDSAYQTWLKEEGIAHEDRVIKAMGSIAEIPFQPRKLEQGYKATLALMEKGVAVIYQGVLMDENMVGLPDLMLRTEGRSRFGNYHYRPLDVKMGSTAKPKHRLQVMAYIAMLEAMQGMRPEGGLLLRLPPAERESDDQTHEEKVVFDLPLYAASLAYVQKLADGQEPDPFIYSNCKSCTWRKVCIPIAEKTQDVSLMSGIERRVWEGLRKQNIRTLQDAAVANPEKLITIKGIAEKTAGKIIDQAKALSTGKVIQKKTIKMPNLEPLIFYDIESEPSENVQYLMGMVVRRAEGDIFEYDIARYPKDEPAMWENFLTRMDKLKGTVFHYGSYEKVAIKGMMEKYGEDQRGHDLLDRFVDLRKVIDETLVLPLKGYSLKQVAPWLGYQWTGDTQAADDSMVEYRKWLEDGDERRLARIIEYNTHDCHATVKIYDWLLTLPRV